VRETALRQPGIQVLRKILSCDVYEVHKKGSVEVAVLEDAGHNLLEQSPRGFVGHAYTEWQRKLPRLTP